MLKSMILDFADFKILLHNFKDLVSDKHYDKMDYRMWRKISSILLSNDSCVFMEWDDYAVNITFGEGYERYYFVFGNNSFGDFIWENLLKDSEYEYEHNAHNSKSNIASNEAIIDYSDKTKTAGTATEERLFDSIASIPLKTISAFEPDISFAIDTKVDKAEFDRKLEELSAQVQAVADKYNNIDKKENSIMKGFNFDFGPMNANVVRMSIYGLAVKNKTGSWVAYDAKNEEIMDVDVFNFDGSKFMYRMPVAINDVAAGDVIVHMSIPMFVVGKSEDGKAVYAVDPVAGERKEIMLARSPFGFNFVTKVVNFLGNAFNADASNPFGNLGLMMMLSEDNAGMKDMLPFMLMANGSNANGFDLSNPMVMYMMCKDGAGDLPMMLALSGAFNKPAPHVCNCGQHTQ